MCVAVVVKDADNDQIVDVIKISSQPFFRNIGMYSTYYQVASCPCRDLVGYMTRE